MHVMNKHVIVCLVNASSFGGEVFLRVSRQVRYLENSLLDRARLSLLSHGGLFPGRLSSRIVNDARFH